MLTIRKTNDVQEINALHLDGSVMKCVVSWDISSRLIYSDLFCALDKMQRDAFKYTTSH